MATTDVPEDWTHEPEFSRVLATLSEGMCPAHLIPLGGPGPEVSASWCAPCKAYWRVRPSKFILCTTMPHPGAVVSVTLEGVHSYRPRLIRNTHYTLWPTP